MTTSEPTLGTPAAPGVAVPALLLHAEGVALRAEIDALRGRIARALAEVEQMLEKVRPYVLSLFQVRLGAWELRVLELRCEVARLQRQVELAQAALNHGRRPDDAAITAEVEHELATWRAQVIDAARALHDAQTHLAPVKTGDGTGDVDVVAIRQVHRELVRALHPDLHPGQDAVARGLWLRVQEAYRHNDLEALRALRVFVGASRNGSVGVEPGAAEDETTLARLAADRDALIGHLTHIERQISDLLASPPLSLRRDLEDDAWVASRRDKLEKAALQLEQTRAGLQERYNQLVGGETVH